MFLSFQITFKNDQFKINLKSSAPSADKLIVNREVTPGPAMKMLFCREKMRGNWVVHMLWEMLKTLGTMGTQRLQVSKPFGWRLKSNYRAAHHSHVTLCWRLHRGTGKIGFHNFIKTWIPHVSRQLMSKRERMRHKSAGRQYRESNKDNNQLH